MTKSVKRVLIATLGVLFVLAVSLFAAACALNNYAITLVYDETKGTVTLSPEKSAYQLGDEVTVFVTPNDGVEVESFTVNGKEEELIEGQFTFDVVGKTTIEVTFEISDTRSGETVEDYKDSSWSTPFDNFTLDIDADGYVKINGDYVTIETVEEVYDELYYYIDEDNFFNIAYGIYAYVCTDDYFGFLIPAASTEYPVDSSLDGVWTGTSYEFEEDYVVEISEGTITVNDEETFVFLDGSDDGDFAYIFLAEDGIIYVFGVDSDGAYISDYLYYDYTDLTREGGTTDSVIPSYFFGKWEGNDSWGDAHFYIAINADGITIYEDGVKTEISADDVVFDDEYEPTLIFIYNDAEFSLSYNDWSEYGEEYGIFLELIGGEGEDTVDAFLYATENDPPAEGGTTDPEEIVIPTSFYGKYENLSIYPGYTLEISEDGVTFQGAAAKVLAIGEDNDFITIQDAYEATYIFKAGSVVDGHVQSFTCEEYNLTLTRVEDGEESAIPEEFHGTFVDATGNYNYTFVVTADSIEVTDSNGTITVDAADVVYDADAHTISFTVDTLTITIRHDEAESFGFGRWFAQAGTFTYFELNHTFPNGEPDGDFGTEPGDSIEILEKYFGTYESEYTDDTLEISAEGIKLNGEFLEITALDKDGFTATIGGRAHEFYVRDEANGRVTYIYDDYDYRHFYRVEDGGTEPEEGSFEDFIGTWASTEPDFSRWYYLVIITEDGVSFARGRSVPTSASEVNYIYDGTAITFDTDGGEYSYTITKNEDGTLTLEEAIYQDIAILTPHSDVGSSPVEGEIPASYIGNWNTQSSDSQHNVELIITADSVTWNGEPALYEFFDEFLVIEYNDNAYLVLLYAEGVIAISDYETGAYFFCFTSDAESFTGISKAFQGTWYEDEGERTIIISADEVTVDNEKVFVLSADDYALDFVLNGLYFYIELNGDSFTLHDADDNDFTFTVDPDTRPDPDDETDDPGYDGIIAESLRGLYNIIDYDNENIGTLTLGEDTVTLHLDYEIKVSASETEEIKVDGTVTVEKKDVEIVVLGGEALLMSLEFSIEKKGYIVSYEYMSGLTSIANDDEYHSVIGFLYRPGEEPQPEEDVIDVPERFWGLWESSDGSIRFSIEPVRDVVVVQMTVDGSIYGKVTNATATSYGDLEITLEIIETNILTGEPVIRYEKYLIIDDVDFYSGLYQINGQLTNGKYFNFTPYSV